MQLPALAIRQPDMTRNLLAVQSIKNQRTRNRLLEAQQAREGAALEARQNLLLPTPPQDALATAGGPTMEAAQSIGQPAEINFQGQAFRQYAALDPEGAEQLLDLTSKMDDRQKAAAKEQADELAKMLLWVEESPDKAGAWMQARTQAEKMGMDVSDAPEQYDPNYIRKTVMEAMSLEDVLTQQAGTLTGDIKEFQFAQDNPEFEAYQTRQRMAGATQVNVGPQGVDYGDPPKDMVWARNPDGTIALEEGPGGFMRPRAVPIAGGPVETEAQAEAEAEAAKQAQRRQYADIVTDNIDRIVGLVDDATVPVTGFGSWLATVPGTRARDVAGLVDTVRANVGFDRLQQMRDASPTGGALGQVSELENRLLQATLGNLELSQSKGQFLRNLKQVRSVYEQIIHEGIGGDSPLVTEILGEVKRPANIKPETWEYLTPEQRQLFK